jgi:hypothetical protein
LSDVNKQRQFILYTNANAPTAAPDGLTVLEAIGQ